MITTFFQKKNENKITKTATVLQKLIKTVFEGLLPNIRKERLPKQGLQYINPFNSKFITT